MKFKIYMDSWLRGEDAYKSFLHRQSDNKECCLGQICVQGGVSIGDLAGKSDPGNIIQHLTSILENLFLDRDDEDDPYCLTDFAVQAMRINDDMEISDDNRISLLTSLAKRNGVELEFVPGVAPWIEGAA